jgi:hypothetical protein
MTIERPMFPPVDPTRRRLLTVAAAGIAAALPVAALANSTPLSTNFEAGIGPATAPNLSINLEIKAGYVIDLTDEPRPAMRVVSP